MAKPTIVITNVGGSIGAACAAAAAATGARLVVSDRDEKAARSVADGLAAKEGAVEFVCGDPANKLHAHNIVAEALETFGRVDAAIHAPAPDAGSGPEKDAFHDLPDDALRARLFDDLGGAVVFNQTIIRQFMKQKAEDDAPAPFSIVNVSLDDNPAYLDPARAASGGGVFAFSRALAASYAREGIRINAVRVGAVAGTGLSDVEAGALRAVAPSGRLGDAADVAAAAIFLSRTDAPFLTGEVLSVEGGGLFSLPAAAKKMQKAKG